MAGNLPAARWTRVSRPAQICDKIPQTFSMVRIPQKRKIVKPIFQFCGPDFPSANTNRLPLKRRAPIASVAAFPAHPLAALPPYGCGVPLAGSERLAGLQQGRHSFYGARPPDLSLRGGRRPTWQSYATGHVFAGSILLSTPVLRDSHVASLLGMTRLGGAVVHQSTSCG